jgi:hypothetical protein
MQCNAGSSMQFNAMEGYTGGRCGNLIEMKGDGRTAEWGRKSQVFSA